VNVEHAPYLADGGAELRAGALGISVESVLDKAREFAKRPNAGGPSTVYEVVWLLLKLAEAFRADYPAAKAARVIFEAVGDDERLLGAIDAAYRLGGAQAVRDLLLRAYGAQG
jgi:hypothetical protein